MFLIVRGYAGLAEPIRCRLALFPRSARLPTRSTLSLGIAGRSSLARRLRVKRRRQPALLRVPWVDLIGTNSPDSTDICDFLVPSTGKAIIPRSLGAVPITSTKRDLHRTHIHNGLSDRMVEVDSEGRIAIPEAIRDRLKLTPGTEVEVRVEHGQIIIEHSNSSEGSQDPVKRMLADSHGDIARHRENIREGAHNHDA